MRGNKDSLNTFAPNGKSPTNDEGFGGMRAIVGGMHQKHLLAIQLGLAVAGVARKHGLTRPELEEHLLVLLPAMDLHTISDAASVAVNSGGRPE